jgi:RNA polymerase primary sigma factor
VHSNEPLITQEEESVLLDQVGRGDQEALSRLLDSHRGLVATIAKRYAGQGLDPDDLIQEGILGLIRAARDHNRDRGTRLATYARHWIKREIARAVARTGGVVGVPPRAAALVQIWKRAADTLGHAVGRLPSEYEIASQLGITSACVSRVRLALAAADTKLETDLRSADGQIVSLESFSPTVPATADERSTSRITPRPWTKLYGWKRLTRPERFALTLRYGLRDQRARSWRSIADIMGISQPAARATHDSAMTKMRAGVKRSRRRLDRQLAKTHVGESTQ